MATREGHFEIRPSANHQFYWRFVASNGQVICHSETYTSKQSCIDSIRLVARNADGADVADHT